MVCKMSMVDLRSGWPDKAIIVTGAAGFIGSHLVERLVELGARVRAFVRYLRDRNRPSDSIATPADGVRALRIAEATYRSAREGHVVKLDEV